MKSMYLYDLEVGMKEWKWIAFIIIIYMIGIFTLGCGEETDKNVDIHNEVKEDGGNLVKQEIEESDKFMQTYIIEEEWSAKEYAKKHNDYMYYSGVWTTNGDSSKDIYSKLGGIILELEIIGTQMRATYTYVASRFNRIVSIENIKTEIKDSSVKYSFEDDGWGNSGQLHLFFDHDCIQIEVTDLVIEKYNTTGMCATGGILYKEKYAK